MNTRVALVIDESGSMNPYVDQVEREYQRQWDTIPNGDIQTVIKFNTRTKSVRGRNDLYFQPNGSTALWDAVDTAISELDDGYSAHLVIVLTDGEENASWRVKAEHLAERIKYLQATDRWTFAFMVPMGFAFGLHKRLGIPLGNITEWEQSREGYERVANQTYDSTQSYYVARSKGVTATASFYTDILSALKPAAVQGNWENIRRVVRVLPVDRECRIDEFVEDAVGHYTTGRGYYQLTKPEKIQGGKRILLMEKGKRPVYGKHHEGRKILGIPDGDVRVIPGNHANWDIFVQSTSVNRKLVRGTKLIYFI